MEKRRLRQRREKLDLSRAEAARRAHLNAATYGQIESGRLIPYDVQLQRICLAMQWDPKRADELLEVADDADD
jgi:DNA-binding XRE family transcriptional regulator